VHQGTVESRDVSSCKSRSPLAPTRQKVTRSLWTKATESESLRISGFAFPNFSISSLRPLNFIFRSCIVAKRSSSSSRLQCGQNPRQTYDEVLEQGVVDSFIWWMTPAGMANAIAEKLPNYSSTDTRQENLGLWRHQKSCYASALRKGRHRHHGPSRFPSTLTPKLIPAHGVDDCVLKFILVVFSGQPDPGRFMPCAGRMHVREYTIQYGPSDLRE